MGIFIIFVSAYFAPAAFLDMSGFPEMVTPSFIIPLVISMSLFAFKQVRQAPAQTKTAVFFISGPIIYCLFTFLFLLAIN